MRLDVRGDPRTVRLEACIHGDDLSGAHAVLASHWEVPSAATMALMTGTFSNMAADPKHDAAEALRKAQLALIAKGDTAHPFEWAAFTLIGDGA